MARFQDELQSNDLQNGGGSLIQIDSFWKPQLKRTLDLADDALLLSSLPDSVDIAIELILTIALVACDSGETNLSTQQLCDRILDFYSRLDAKLYEIFQTAFTREDNPGEAWAKKLSARLLQHADIVGSKLFGSQYEGDLRGTWPNFYFLRTWMMLKSPKGSVNEDELHRNDSRKRKKMLQALGFGTVAPPATPPDTPFKVSWYVDRLTANDEDES